VARGILTLWRDSRKSGGKSHSSPPDTIVGPPAAAAAEPSWSGSKFSIDLLVPAKKSIAAPEAHSNLARFRRLFQGIHRHRMKITAAPPSRRAEDFTPLFAAEKYKNAALPQNASSSLLHHPFSECPSIPSASLNTLGASHFSATSTIYYLLPSPA